MLVSQYPKCVLNLEALVGVWEYFGVGVLESFGSGVRIDIVHMGSAFLCWHSVLLWRLGVPWSRSPAFIWYRSSGWHCTYGVCFSLLAFGFALGLISVWVCFFLGSAFWSAFVFCFALYSLFRLLWLSWLLDKSSNASHLYTFPIYFLPFLYFPTRRLHSVLCNSDLKGTPK